MSFHSNSLRNTIFFQVGIHISPFTETRCKRKNELPNTKIYTNNVPKKTFEKDNYTDSLKLPVQKVTSKKELIYIKMSP